jgi:lysozyme
MTLPDETLAWPIPWEAVVLIAGFESCRLQAYLCPAKKWTCGWGNTGPDVDADTEYSQEEADQIFCDRLTEFTEGVKDACTREPTENQLGALVAFAFNVGLGAFGKSKLLEMHDRGCWQCAVKEFGRWNRAAGVVLAGLTRRRAAEAALYSA